jgi:hypothetical protein
MCFLSQCWKTLVRFLKSPRAWIYLVFVTCGVVIEERDEVLSVSPGKLQGECENVGIAARLFYERYATAEFRKPRPHYVCLMALSQETVPAEIWQSKCKKRKFLADALKNLATLGPALIAIDISFLPHICKGSEDEASSLALQDAIRDVSSTIPLVIVEDDKTETELREAKLDVHQFRDIPRLRSFLGAVYPIVARGLI